MEKMNRIDILDNAKKCVCGDRDQSYGRPEDSFSLIARLWDSYLHSEESKEHRKIEPRDVAAMLSLMKIARIRTGVYKADNWVDLAGYAACGGEIESVTSDDIQINAKKDFEQKVHELLGKE